MSYRELAEAAPCSVSTVTRAMPRLRAAGWLQVAERGRGRTVLDADATLPENRCSVEAAHATRWRLLDAHSEHTGGTPLARTELSVLTLRAPCTARARLDACRWRGLGLNAPRVLEALVGGPLSDVELAGRLNLNRGNLRSRLLPRLAMFALVSRTATGWELSADLGTAMAAAAENLGLAGKAAAVAERHQAEREQYLVHREEFRGFRLSQRERIISASVAARRSANVAEHDAGVRLFDLHLCARDADAGEDFGDAAFVLTAGAAR